MIPFPTMMAYLNSFSDPDIEPDWRALAVKHPDYCPILNEVFRDDDPQDLDPTIWMRDGSYISQSLSGEWELFMDHACLTEGMNHVFPLSGVTQETLQSLNNMGRFLQRLRASNHVITAQAEREALEILAYLREWSSCEHPEWWPDDETNLYAWNRRYLITGEGWQFEMVDRGPDVREKTWMLT